MKQKLLEMVQEIVQKYFYFDEICKMKEVGPKNMYFFTLFEKSRLWPYLLNFSGFILLSLK